MTDRTFSPDELKHLVCPACHQALELDAAASAIRCIGCGRRYPIVDGLPVLIARG
jgi:LSD1 subclass zinc finger protein